MSNISRRKFLKGAGVAALAVAASGVLAGCSNIPVTPNKPGSSDIPENPSLEKPVYDALFTLPGKTLSQDNGLRSLASDLAKAQIAGNQQEVRARIESKKRLNPMMERFSLWTHTAMKWPQANSLPRAF